MSLTEQLNSFINRLKASLKLQECEIFKAYPSSFAPTRPKKIMIAVSLGELSADNTEVGGESLYGSYRLNADIFFPYGMNETQSVIEAVIGSQLGEYPASVSVSAPECNDSIGCVCVKCGFVFYANMSFGGADNEQ